MKIDEETTTSSIPSEPHGKLPCGTPFFRVPNDLFFNIAFNKREKGKWFSKHYQDIDLAKWCKSNPDKAFYIQNEENGIHVKIFQ